MHVAISLIKKHVRQVCKQIQFAQTEIVEFQPILARHPQRLYITCGTIGRLSWNAVISVDVDFFRLPIIQTIVVFGIKFQLNFVTTNNAEQDRYWFVLLPNAFFLFEEKLNCVMTSSINNFVAGTLVHTVHCKKRIWMMTRQLKCWADLHSSRSTYVTTIKCPRNTSKSAFLTPWCKITYRNKEETRIFKQNI